MSVDVLVETIATAADPAGLQLSAMPRSVLRQALQHRLKRTGIEDHTAYRAFLCENASEQEALLEELLVHESFFFRDAGAFAEMRRWCLEWLATHDGVLRILSAPCSTGEEPYSLAAMLWMAGVPPERFLVDATDISTAALRHAQAALYAGLSLRGLPKEKAPEFLESTPRGWLVRREVRERVRFSRLNLVDAGEVLAASGPYDLICSRNLLLYQTSEAKARLVAAIADALAPKGRLVIGAADWCTELAAAFDLTGPPEGFALTRRALAHAPSRAVSKAKTRALPASLPEVPAAASAQPSPSPKSAEEHDEDAEYIGTLLRRAQKALGQGRWEEAERMCRQALYLDGSNLPALELLRTVWAPRMPERFRRALDARIQRHTQAEEAVEEGR